MGIITSAVIGGLTLVSMLFHAAQSLDARYAHATEVAAIVAQIDKNYAKAELARMRDRLSFLVNKQQRTPDEENEIAFLRQQILDLEKLLAGRA